MENQHRKIDGYRELTQSEIDIMNDIKAHGTRTQQLLNRLHSHVQQQIITARNNNDPMEEDRLDAAQPQRWLAIARTEFQDGVMHAVRAIAQPTIF